MFVSVKEAVDITGMSQTTIYRLCKKRSHTKFVKKEDNKYFIDREYLLATYPKIAIGNTENANTSYERTALNTPNDELIEFGEEKVSTLGEKIIDDISDKITQRFNKANDINLDDETQSSQNNMNVPWESVIGASIGVLVIVGFIVMLYFGSK